ncbi:MAG: hypothetical protein ACI35R_07015 [Bacillus sp. (in: firmicutes)]
MAKNIVVGVYRFLGYHLCCHLLDLGEEVIGIEMEEEVIADRDDKAMTFGRNANFVYQSLEEFTETDEESLVCICLLDYAMAGSQSWQRMRKKIGYIIEKCKAPRRRILIFLPYELDSDRQKEVEQLRNELRKQDNIQWIRMTDVYGPWLPEHVDIKAASCLPRALYIEDFCKEWDALLAIGQEEVTVTGELQEDWQEQIANFHSGEPGNRHPDIMDSPDMLIIKAYTSLEDGLQAMREHQMKRRLFQNWRE